MRAGAEGTQKELVRLDDVGGGPIAPLSLADFLTT